MKEGIASILVFWVIWSICFAPASAQEGQLRYLADYVPVSTSSEGDFQINSCPTVWVENKQFYLCDTVDLIVAFAPSIDEAGRELEYYVAVWNTGGRVFDYHPQHSILRAWDYDPYKFGFSAVPHEVTAVSYDELAKNLRKKERNAGIIMALSYGLEAAMATTTPTSDSTSTVVTPGSPTVHQVSTRTYDRVAAEQILQKRANTLQQAMYSMASQNRDSLSYYAKSNTLADGMMTAGRVLFPRLKRAKFGRKLQLQVDIQDRRFVFHFERGDLPNARP